MKDDNIKTVEAYLDALKNHDLARAPISENIRFENPISGSGQGVEAFTSFLSGFLLSIRGIDVLRHVSEGDSIATHWEVDSDFGKIRVLEIFRIRDGKIEETAAYFDPRPIFGSK